MALQGAYYCCPHDTGEAQRDQLIAQGHPASKWQSQDPGPSQLDASPWALISSAFRDGLYLFRWLFPA